MTAFQDASPERAETDKNAMRKPLNGVEFLYQKPMRTADFFKSRTGLKTQELLRLLWGTKSAPLPKADAPRKRIDLQVFTPTGRPAVDICCG